MKKRIYNPYLPLYEYIPDGEPRLFKNRVYIYGSHDEFGSFNFCNNSYVTYSCPKDDFSDWKYEGIIYDKNEDPMNKKGNMQLFAPDVIEGLDGSYYMYYSLNWSNTIGVAKADNPAGPFHYYGNVSYPNGIKLGYKDGDPFQFDPAIFIDDDNRIYLYSGMGPVSFLPQIPLNHKADGCYVMELDKDMLTVISEPKRVLAKKGMAFVDYLGHEFFEAASMRKINGIYYLIYSSINGHELCYATSNNPCGPFTYGGTIISNGDVYLNGRSKMDAIYPLGNNHGSILTINDKHYIFYHRHTNFTNTDRQGLAEVLKIESNGSIKQIEMTSQGLNEKPLEGLGEYPATICSALKPKEGNVFYPFFRPFFKNNSTMITQYGKDEDTFETQFIKNIKDGCLIGYKYFDLSNTNKISLKVDGRFNGRVDIKFNEYGKSKYYKTILITPEISYIDIRIDPQNEKEALYFKFTGTGSFNLYAIKFE